MTPKRRGDLAAWRLIRELVERGKLRQALAAFDAALEVARSVGYSEGYEDQMQMRIRDEQERRAGEGV